MDSLIDAISVLKMFGIGGAAGGVLFSIYQFWLYTSVRGNRKDIDCIKEENVRQRDCITSLSAKSDDMNKKLDKLLELHLNGKR